MANDKIPCREFGTGRTVWMTEAQLDQARETTAQTRRWREAGAARDREARKARQERMAAENSDHDGRSVILDGKGMGPPVAGKAGGGGDDIASAIRSFQSKL